MSSIPSGLARVPNLLRSQISLSNLTRTNIDLLRVQGQLASGKAINRVSDDAVRSATIMELQDRLERGVQRQRNIEHARASLGVLDKALGEAGDLSQEAKSMALAQIGFPTGADERRGQAVVVNSLISSLFNTANRQGVAGYVFGGSQPEKQPFEELLGGYRYVGQGAGLSTELGLAESVPITIGGATGLGSTSARVRGTVDLDPTLTATTRLSDLSGARGLGITPGQIEFSFDNGVRTKIDLSTADTVQDVIDSVTSALRQYETDNGVTMLGPGAVSFSGSGLSIDVVADVPNPPLQFFEVGGGVTAQDLGIAAAPVFSFVNGAPAGLDLNPRITWRTPVSALAGVTGGLGSIKVTNGSGTATVDLSSAVTLEDVKNLIEGTKLGVRVAINGAGTGIDVYSELAAGEKGAMAIEEVPGSNATASRLGIRSLSTGTQISDFNFGRGVGIVDGAKDPITGLPDPARDVDFFITLGDVAATRFTVDLRPQDIVSVQTVINRINSEVGSQLTAAGYQPGDLVAGLSNGANGLTLVQSPTFPNAITVTGQNNSPAADQLGFSKGTYFPTSATFIGEDRAKVRVDGLFSDLIDLRNALAGNNTAGIGFASEKLAGSIDALSQARGTVGGFAQRVEYAEQHEEDATVFNEQVRSQMEDLDYTEAATRFSLLQTQLAAGLRSTASASSLTLLDFLG